METAKQATEVAIPDTEALMADLILLGDLSRLSPERKIQVYVKTAESLGLNPLTQPFAYLRLNNKEVLYVKKDATDQLRKLHKVSITLPSKEIMGDVYVVTAKARTPDGREDESTGAVHIGRLQGDARANAMMKAETKSKRRVTLSIVGLGWMDESEVESIPGAEKITTAQQSTLEPAPSIVPLRLTADEVAALYAYGERYGWEKQHILEAVLKAKTKKFSEVAELDVDTAEKLMVYIQANPKGKIFPPKSNEGI